MISWFKGISWVYYAMNLILFLNETLALEQLRRTAGVKGRKPAKRKQNKIQGSQRVNRIQFLKNDQYKRTRNIFAYHSAIWPKNHLSLIKRLFGCDDSIPICRLVELDAFFFSISFFFPRGNRWTLMKIKLKTNH